MNNQQNQPFDPWTATDQAEAEAESERQGQGKYGLPLLQWLAARRIVASKEQILNGKESLPLMMAVYDCLKHGLLAPSWLTDKFSDSLFILHSAQAKSLDEAFGRPFPKGKHVKSLMKNEILRHNIFFYVSRAVEDGKSITKGFWEEVSAHFTGGDSQFKEMEELYNECCAEFCSDPVEKRKDDRKKNRSA